MAGMTDFKIRRGLSTDLFQAGELNSNVVLELGCWYLCTDTAELFLCTDVDGRVLKRINSTKEDITVIDIELDSSNNLLLYYSNGSVEIIDLDHIVTDIVTKIGYATTDFVKAEITKAQLAGAEVDLDNYATKEYVINLLEETTITVLDGGDI